MLKQIKLITLLLLTGLIAHAQTIDVSIGNKKQTVEQWLSELNVKSGVSMTYNAQLADLSIEVELTKQTAPVEQIIEKLLNTTTLTFTQPMVRLLFTRRRRKKKITR
ncbi:MAG: hypothetical protein KDC99_17455 [Cyclobacteriaceae bacterium]|nr:hypothetical protein [Cyclobacteriaceae bacterium]